jgi:hypoxanthine-guanine phosphoribosyltransferase
MKTLLLENGASSVGLIVLVNKDTVRSDVDTPLLVGFTTPDVWLVGMGMDDADTATEARKWDGYIGEVS